MGFSLLNKVIRNPVRLGLLILSTVHVSNAENAAQDLGGFSANKIREINTFKADQNLQLREARQNMDESFGGIAAPLTKLQSLKIPQLQGIGEGKTVVPNSQIVNPEQNDSNESAKIESKFDGQKAVDKLLNEYEELRTSVKENGKNYSQNQAIVGKMDADMVRLLEIKNTLQEVPEKYFSSGRPDFDKQIEEVASMIDVRARARFNGLKPDKDEDFLKKLDSLEDEQAKETTPVSSSEKSNNQENGNNVSNNLVADGDELEVTKELNGIELVRSKCSGSVGSKNGAALVKHLTSGDCAQAINANPELKSKYNIKKIVELISAWGFRTASFSSQTNIKLGINKLPELGITLDLNKPKSGFKAIPYQPAVDVQQSQLLTTEEDSSDGPLTELMKTSKDKAVLRHSVRD